MTKKQKKKEEKESIFDSIASEVKHSVLSIVFIAMTVFFMLSPFGKAGIVGDKTYELLHALLGVGYYILPLLLTLLATSLIKNSRPKLANTTIFASFLFFISSLGIITLLGKNNVGGWLGGVIEAPLVKLFDIYISFVFLIMFVVISLLVIFNARPSTESLLFWKKFLKKKEKVDEEDEEEEEIEEDEEEVEEEIEEEDGEEEEIVPEKEKQSLKNIFGLGKNPSQSFLDNYTGGADFTPPPLKLLGRDRGKPGYGDIKANTNIIKRSLQNFGINVEMDEVSVGPTVTRYSLKPAEGVKLSRIVGLQNDLALALAAHPIRIEAPIPGKSLVGIEIPNSTKTTVGLGTLLEDSEYQQSEKSLMVALGKSISGKSHFSDLAKMPHLLIAGATGSGKSVTVHAIITSLLFRNPPENLRFILIDPKRVELTLYNEIPHLLTPVITNPKKAIRVLNWA
ncbi:MAG: DNA translocase FtsK, partial [Candidatus Pacebacteria bacterium]|nr:DNA translocase FtsK [Candidatus Paceibacterota bacterium]